MRVTHLHPWDLSPREAMRLQAELAARIVRAGSVPEASVRYVAGSDVAFDKPNGRGCGAVVVLAYPSLDVVERVTVESPVTFPYVPGLLSFRETPVLLPAFERLRQAPELLLVDGHGYAHPRRFGFASHLGLLLGIPTIGVAKSRLIGEQGVVAGPRGSRADLTHDGGVIGSMLRTRQGVRSIYVSVGNGISLEDAERWVLRCARGYRVPEPTRLADRLAGEAKRRMLELTVEIVIEQRPGERGRWEWSADTDTVTFLRDDAPYPSYYGCVPGIINPADNEPLDVMLVDAAGHARGDRVTVRVVDVLLREDGDHKLLAAPVTGSPDVSAAMRRALHDFHANRHPLRGWGGEEAALELIRACVPQP